MRDFVQVNKGNNFITMTVTRWADKPNTISVFSIDENTDGIEYYSEKDKQTVKIAIYDKSIGFV